MMPYPTSENQNVPFPRSALLPLSGLGRNRRGGVARSCAISTIRGSRVILDPVQGGERSSTAVQE